MDREEFVKTLPDDPSIQKFVAATDGFTDGKYDALTTITEHLNKGDEAAAKKVASDTSTDFEQAKIINDAVKGADSKEVHLWRGLGVKEKIAGFENLKPGDDLDIAGVKSFSWDKAISFNYAAKNGPITYMLEVQGQAKGVSISSLS
jgi:hypothetical protein